MSNNTEMSLEQQMNIARSRLYKAKERYSEAISYEQAQKAIEEIESCAEVVTNLNELLWRERLNLHCAVTCPKCFAFYSPCDCRLDTPRTLITNIKQEEVIDYKCSICASKSIYNDRSMFTICAMCNSDQLRADMITATDNKCEYDNVLPDILMMAHDKIGRLR